MVLEALPPRRIKQHNVGGNRRPAESGAVERRRMSVLTDLLCLIGPVPEQVSDLCRDLFNRMSCSASRHLVRK